MNTLRTRAPKATLTAIQPYIDQAGITRLANLTHLDVYGVPVYACYRPYSKNLSVSQGKGTRDEWAQCSAYMEAIEHYFAETVRVDIHQATQPKQDPQYKLWELFPPGVLNPQTMPLDWTKVHCLNTDTPYYIPQRALSFDLTQQHSIDGMWQRSTTGLASGNTTQEALCHGLYEIFERANLADFFVLDAHEQSERHINLASIEEADLCQLITTIHAQQSHLILYDATMDIDFPTYYAVIEDHHPIRQLGCFSGSGCHAHSDIAISRAITEALQSRITAISGARDDMFPEQYQHQDMPQPKQAGRATYQISTPATMQIPALYNDLLDYLEQQDWQALHYLYTQSTDAISVVNVIIPGLST